MPARRAPGALNGQNGSIAAKSGELAPQIVTSASQIREFQLRIALRCRITQWHCAWDHYDCGARAGHAPGKHSLNVPRFLHACSASRSCFRVQCIIIHPYVGGRCGAALPREEGRAGVEVPRCCWDDVPRDGCCADGFATPACVI